MLEQCGIVLVHSIVGRLKIKNGCMIVVAILSFVPAGLIAAAIFLVGKRFTSIGVSATAACIAGFVVSLFLTQPTLSWIVSQSTDTRLNCNPNLASEVMETAELNADLIADFCFQTSFRSSSPVADFKMPLPDFLDWMMAEGWDPQEFNDESGHVQLRVSNSGDEKPISVTTKVFPLRSRGGQGEHLVTHGYLVHKRVGESARTFIYDMDSERVYFCHSIY